MGLLHRRTHLAVPHAHGRLREVVAQLQTHEGKGILSLRIRFPEPLHLIRFAQRGIKATHKVTFLLRGIHLLTLSIVPVRRIPTCCIRLVAPRVRLQSSKKVSQNGKENTSRLVCGDCSSHFPKSFWNFFSYRSDVILH